MADDVTTTPGDGRRGEPHGAGLSGSDWPARAADVVEEVVTFAHDRVIRPLVIAARALVFGILVAAMALVLAVLLAIAVVRLVDSYAFGHRVWAAEALVGGVITVVGLLAWSLRRPRDAGGSDR